MTENTRDYFMFIKISEEKFIDSFQKEGHIYCNTIQYFRSVEDNSLRGDKYEGKSYLKQVSNLELLIKGKTIAISVKAQLYLENPDDKGNIFCLYGVETSLVDTTKKSLQSIVIDDSSKGFGNFALLIIDPQSFITRIDKKLKNLKMEYNFSPVNYFDPNEYEGELSPFYKSNKFHYQNEVRLWIPNKLDKPFDFFIGDISDISYKIPVTDLGKLGVQIIESAHTQS